MEGRLLYIPMILLAAMLIAPSYPSTVSAGMLSDAKKAVSEAAKGIKKWWDKPSGGRELSKPIGRYRKNEAAIAHGGKLTVVNGREAVVKDARTIQRDRIDSAGRTNCQRMQAGLAPIVGPNDKPMELHHMRQENDGLLVEVPYEEHKEFYSELHRYKDVSEIDRPQFRAEREGHWKARAAELCPR